MTPEVAPSPQGRGYRVLLAKVGLDGHNRGVHVLRRALQDDGFEVVYLGIRRSPAEIAAAAVQEDVACVGVSILSGAHRTALPAVRQELDSRGAESIPLVAGGIIPDTDVPWLTQRGIRAVFGPGISVKVITDSVKHICAERDRQEI